MSLPSKRDDRVPRRLLDYVSERDLDRLAEAMAVLILPAVLRRAGLDPHAGDRTNHDEVRRPH